MKKEIEEIIDKIKKTEEAGELGMSKIAKIEPSGIGINIFFEKVCHSVALEKLQEIALPYYKRVYVSTLDITDKYSIQLRIV